MSKLFGQRFLQDESKVYEFNAWDNVDLDPEITSRLDSIIKTQAETRIPVEQQSQYLANSGQYWNKFYDRHDLGFFKDRKWLKTEFPELFEAEVELSVLEAGCGVGNSLKPLLEHHAQYQPANKLKLYGCDFSQSAVDLMLAREDFVSAKNLTVFQHDITLTVPSSLIQEQSLSHILLVFALSAIPPVLHKSTLTYLAKLLKPGGQILFRDYGRYDLTQLRFKKNRMLDDFQYVRGDGTQVYYFSEDELILLAADCGLQVQDFGVDRRLLVNRATKQKMYRVWMQLKFLKPI